MSHNRIDTLSQNLRSILHGEKNIPFYDEVADKLDDPLFKLAGTTHTKEHERLLTFQWIELMQQKGLTQIGFSEEHGGGGSAIDQIRAYEIMAYLGGSAIIKPGVQLGLFGGAIDNLGSDEQKEKYINDIMNLKLLGCFLMTEQDNGSNAANIQTRATYIAETDEIEIHTPNDGAIKRYIGNGLDGQMGAATVRLIVDGVDHGAHMVLVPLRDVPGGPTVDGVKIVDEGHKIGLNGVDNVRVRFNKLRVPRENLLSHFANITADGEYVSEINSASKRFFATISTLITGRMFVGATALSFAKKAETIVGEYASKRIQFGQRLIDIPVYRRKVLPRIATTFAMDILKEYGYERLAGKTEENSVEVESLISAMKAYFTWHASETLTIMRESCGGDGYLWENGFGQLKADTDVFKTFEGANDVLMSLYGKNCLKAFAANKSKLSLFKQQAVLFVETRMKRHSLVQNNIDLTNNEELLSLLQWRDTKMVSELANEIYYATKNGKKDHVQATMERQDKLNALGPAHIEALAMEKFIDAIENTKNIETRALLEKTAQLFALSAIENNAKWYLENGYLNGHQSKSISDKINAICKDITEKDEQLSLVRGFAVPQHLVNVPLLERVEPGTDLGKSNLMTVTP